MTIRSPSSDHTAKSFSQASTPRWADIEFDDETDFSETDLGLELAPVLEDSYRCKPDPALEDSNRGVIEQMRSLDTVSTDDESKENNDPKDFGFLLRKQKPRSALTPLSARAPEFFPTEVTLLTPTCRRTSSGSVLASTKKRSGVSGKKPLRKRGRCAVTKARSVSEFSEDSASAVSCSNFSLDQFEMPEMTEEEWRQREAKRMWDIKLCKETPEYLRFCELVPTDARESGMPTTPRASDRTISIRRWKASVQEWRVELSRQLGQQETTRACVKDEETLVV